MLSKSKYLGGLQCEKRLWMEKHQRELRDEPSESLKALFAQGAYVGRLAQKLYPDGIDCTPDFTRKDGQGMTIGLNMTKEAVRNKEEAIYEAAFVANDVYAATDILVREGSRWRAIEVKSSTDVKGYHIHDAALQYYVLTQAGIDLVDIELMYIDTNYERHGSLNLEELFARQSVLEDVKSLQAEIPATIRLFKELYHEKKPEVDIGPHCSDPYDCPFKGHCWSHVPDNSVFDLNRIGKKAWQLYEQGAVAIKDVPASFPLTRKQRNQAEASQRNEGMLDVQAISEFFADWEFPLYFFDFETVASAAPMYEGTRPYEAIPFQYSLHIVREAGGKAEHHEFLADPKADDPRPALVRHMLKDLGKKGSIVTYNMGFEKGKISALAEAFPEQSTSLLALNERVVDLIVPFRNQWCYEPEMKGSASIKSVLPALTDLSYSHLEIQEGGMASATWLSIAEGRFTGSAAAKLDALKAYCELDTRAMVEIWKVLVRKTSKKK